MNCHQVERIFIDGGLSAAQPLPLDAEEHVTTCQGCRQLLAVFRMPSTAGGNSSADLTRLTAVLTAELLPARPLAPMGSYLMAFAGVFVSIVTLGVYREGARSLSAMNPLQAVSILCLLGASASLLAWSLVLQMVPGSRHRLRPEVLPAVVIASLSIAAGTLFEFRSETGFWHGGWTCLRTGMPFALLVAMPFWLLLRRGAILSPKAAGTTAGLLAGLAGTTVLEIRCVNLDLVHILVWHFGVAAAGAFAGFVIGVAGEVFGRYMSYRVNARV